MPKPYQKKQKPDRKDKYGYTGILLEPITLTPMGLCSDRERENIDITSEINKRLLALIQHYASKSRVLPSRNDDLGMWLALELAKTHIKGFQFIDYDPDQRGRRPIWNKIGPSLVDDVERQVSQGKSVRDACVNLAVKAPYRGMAVSARSLETRYYEETQDGRLAAELKKASARLPDELREQFDKDMGAATRSFAEDITSEHKKDVNKLHGK